MRFRHVCRMFLVHWRSLTCPGPVFTMPVTSLSASRHWNSTNVRRLQSLLLRLVGPRNMVMAARCKYTQQTVHCWSPRLFLSSVPLHGMTFSFLSDRSPLWTQPQNIYFPKTLAMFSVTCCCLYPSQLSLIAAVSSCVRVRAENSLYGQDFAIINTSVLL